MFIYNTAHEQKYKNKIPTDFRQYKLYASKIPLTLHCSIPSRKKTCVKKKRKIRREIYLHTHTYIYIYKSLYQSRKNGSYQQMIHGRKFSPASESFKLVIKSS